MFIMTQTWLIIVAAVTLVHWLLPSRVRAPFIAVATAAFIGFYSLPSLIILTVFAALLMAIAGRPVLKGNSLVGLIIVFMGVLFYYKILAAFTPSYDIDQSTFGQFIIPLGLSYYAFRCIHYAIEKYKAALPPHDHWDVLYYLFYLPTVMAGPIHRFPAFHKDAQRKRWDGFMFAEGLERLLYGYTKIIFLGNFLTGYILELTIRDLQTSHESLAAYLDMWQTGLSLYFLFAGASDVAIGFGLLLGIRVMENFKRPFLARNIADFWTRWHISLTSWCRDYIYMGTVSVTRIAALAALASMLTLGLWHEFSLRYLVWGLYHGAGIIIWQGFQKIKQDGPLIKNVSAQKILQIGATLFTLHFVLVGFMIVRHDSFSGFFQTMKIMIGWPS